MNKRKSIHEYIEEPSEIKTGKVTSSDCGSDCVNYDCLVDAINSIGEA
jgi:hypothetical protein